MAIPYEENGGLPLYQKNNMAPSAPSLGVQHSDPGRLGDDFGSTLFSVPGNPSKSIMGGDNRADMGKTAPPGNPPVGQPFSNQYDWPGDNPLFCVEHNPSPDELKSMFRGGSDRCGVDGSSY